MSSTLLQASAAVFGLLSVGHTVLFPIPEAPEELYWLLRRSRADNGQPTQDSKLSQARIHGLVELWVGTRCVELWFWLVPISITLILLYTDCIRFVLTGEWFLSIDWYVHSIIPPSQVLTMFNNRSSSLAMVARSQSAPGATEQSHGWYREYLALE